MKVNHPSVVESTFVCVLSLLLQSESFLACFYAHLSPFVKLHTNGAFFLFRYKMIYCIISRRKKIFGNRAYELLAEFKSKFKYNFLNITDPKNVD